MNCGIAVWLAVNRFHFDNGIMNLLIRVSQDSEGSVRILDDGRESADTADFKSLCVCQILISLIFRACIPGIPIQSIVQSGNVVVCFLIRPDHKTDGIGTVVHENADR